jgi:hypothetical protein
MIDHKSIQKEIKNGLKNKTILTETQATTIAKKYISKDEPSYQATIAISDLLPKNVKEIIDSRIYKHPWFTGKITSIVYIDTFGRMWSRTKGVIKKNVKIQFINGHYIINALGGMMWNSKKGKTFICEYRTELSEIKNRVSPQTFIG